LSGLFFSLHESVPVEHKNLDLKNHPREST